MKIETVLADAFGPFTRQQLDLGPGMTIIHGPNEAGKSSWFAAMLAGLCGIRRGRGRGTKDQVEFKDRHRPWNTRGWKVGLTFRLDDGSQRTLVHNLSNGRCLYKDSPTGKELNAGDLDNDGSADGARLLGLNRDSARATIFMGQAEIRRVLDEADGLQEFLQRAATSHTVDTTVDQALDWIAEQRRSRVGQLNIGQRPLRLAMNAHEDARRIVDSARDDYDNLQRVLVERKKAKIRLSAAEKRVDKLSAAAEWKKIEGMRKRIKQAQELREQMSRAGRLPEPADGNLCQEVAEALGAFKDRGEAPSPPSGESALEIRKKLDALPSPPHGDLEESTTAREAYDRMREAASKLTTHEEASPAPTTAATVDTPPERLRALADTLERKAPAVNSNLIVQIEYLEKNAAANRTAFERERQNYEKQSQAYEGVQTQYGTELERYKREQDEYQRQSAIDGQAFAQASRDVPPDLRSQSRLTVFLISLGLLLFASGVAVAVSLSPVTGGLLVLAALVMITVGIARRFGARAGQQRGRSAVERTAMREPPPAPPSPPILERPGPPPVVPTEDPSLPELRARVQLQDESLSSFKAATNTVHLELERLSLPADPAHLRQLARDQDMVELHQKAAEEWARQHQQLTVALSDAVHHLLVAIGNRLVAADEDSPSIASSATVEHATNVYRTYVQSCKNRAAQATDSNRRPDLENTLKAREETDRQHKEATDRYVGTEARLVAIAEDLALGSDRPPYSGLEEWLKQQEDLRKQHAQIRETTAKLEQLLEGTTVEQLTTKLQAAELAAGERPETIPEDVEAQRLDWISKRQRATADMSDLAGEARTLQERLPSVAEAIEAEKGAERDLENVRRLASILGLVAMGLESAKAKVNASIAPALAATIRPWLPRVTGGRYSDLVVDPETLLVKVREGSGEFRAATVMSHGTMEQVYLLLRLALAEHLSTGEETAPVILDDVTVHSDQERTEAFLELLHELSQDRQVVLFTQEQEVIDWASVHLIAERDRLVEVSIA